MRFKVSMINAQGNYYKETVIANNLKEAKSNVQNINPKSKVLESKWIYN